MMLTEQTTVPEEALPVTAFRDHLKLGSGFADDGLQDPVLVTCLKAAIAAVESETSKALISRQFNYVVSSWRDIARLDLPVAPVTEVVSFSVTDILGSSEAVEATSYNLLPDFYRPVVQARGWSLPVIPDGGTAEISFTAGFGPAWEDLPADLAQAVLMLATHFYDNRSALGDRTKLLPRGVSSLLRRYLPVRILGGSR